MDKRNCPMSDEDAEERRKRFLLWSEKMRELTGIEDLSGQEIRRKIHRLASLYDSLSLTEFQGLEVTGSRLGILVRLYIEDLFGPGQGLTPTFLSEMANVGKNTISSLIKGLESQGLVRREGDTNDRRTYRLRLTESGREFMSQNTPRYIEYVNSLASALTVDERKQLNALLDKLLISMIEIARSKNDFHGYHPEEENS